MEQEQPPRVRSMTTGTAKRLFSILAAASLLAAACLETAAADTYDIIYRDIGSLPCVTLLWSGGTIGCQSVDATEGVLYKTDTQADIATFIANRGDLPSKYTIVMPYSLLTDDNLQQLQGSKNLGGVIVVINGTDTTYSIASRPTTPSSPDTTCPNCEYGLYASQGSAAYQWNPTGTGLLMKSYNFPIYALDTIDSRNTISYNAILQAVEVNHARGFGSYPLNAVQFNAFMWAAEDAYACLRRNWCTPVGGASVWSTPSVDISKSDNKPIVVVSAAMDSRSFFHDLTLGVDSSISGVVALLAIADALSRSTVPLDSMQKHIVYTLFTAEAWGYGGSQRFVQDVWNTNFQCITPPDDGSNTSCKFPFYSNLDFQRLNADKIDTIIEVSQVGLVGSTTATPAFFAHVDDSSTTGASFGIVQQLMALGGGSNSTANGGASIVAANSDGVQRGLPPASAQSFLKQKKSISAVVLTGYQKAMNPVTSSDFDDVYDPVKTAAAISAAANSVAQSVWLQAQGVATVGATNAATMQQQAQATIQVNQTLVQQMLGCFTYNYSCPLIDQFLNVSSSAAPPARLPHYTGTLYSQSQPFPMFAWSYLANITASLKVDNSSTATPPASGSAALGTKGCSTTPNTVKCDSSAICVLDRCIRSLTRYHDAYGTGLTMDDKSRYTITDATKSTWVEATWDPIGLRLFEVTSPSSQKIELAIAAIMTVIAIVAAWFSKKYMAKTLKVA